MDVSSESAAPSAPAEIKIESKVDEDATVNVANETTPPAATSTPSSTNPGLSKADLEVMNGIVRRLTEHESAEYVLSRSFQSNNRELIISDLTNHLQSTSSAC